MDNGGMQARMLEIYQESLQAIYRLAYTYLQNRAEAEKAAQETFARFVRSGVDLGDATAGKGWLIRTVTGICLKKLNTPGYRIKDDPAPHEIDRTMRAIMALPGKYKTVVYLFYYEGCTAREIAELTGDAFEIVSTIIGDARKRLAARLGGGFDD